MADKKITFEEALRSLTSIVEKLEDGSLSLEESLKLYEEGIALTSFCEKHLKNAKLKISELKDENDD